MPAPPATVNAPVVVEKLADVLLTLILLVVVNPLLVTLCKVLVFHIVIAPVLVLIAVSVPAVKEV